MRTATWKTLNMVDWKREARREYMLQADYQSRVDLMFKTGHLAESFNNRREWMRPGIFAVERRGYWNHLYIGGPEGVRHIISHELDDSQNRQAQSQGYVQNAGHLANKIEQKIFKELNGVDERKAFGYSDPGINKCVPKQLYYINTRWIDKKIKCAGKADYSSHYPANICGPLPNWDKRKMVPGTVDPTPEYPFVFYTQSGFIAEYNRLDTHQWLNEDLVLDLFGKNYTKVDPDKDVSIMCPASKYTLDSTIEKLYIMKSRGESIDGMSAKEVLVSSIGYKHLTGEFNTRNRLYHLAAICIARANQRMVDLYNKYSKSILQIIVDSVIYMGPTEIGIKEKRLGELHQEITNHSFIMRGANQYMFIDPVTGECSSHAHSGFDTNIETTRLEDIRLWQRSPRIIQG